MTLFDVLRSHALDRPDAVAVSTPYRVASYRKMWSRIERSTARLQGEWSIRPGDVVAYLGCGHLDALVTYFAAARCGARLMPLEHTILQKNAVALMEKHAAVLVLHDDALIVAEGEFHVACRPLSSLIATACRHRGLVLEDSAAVSLLEFAEDDAHLHAPVAATRLRTLDTLAALAAACPAGRDTVSGPLFDEAVFAPVILAGMLAGTALHFLPQKNDCRT
ncbi:MAG: hypothetical protein NVSMB6_08080 [Burkholderiaceae bacterium]